MVKKQEDWTSFTGDLTNSTNIRKYLDLCKEWLITHDEKNNTVTKFYNVGSGTAKAPSDTIFGLDELAIRNSSNFSCAVCKECFAIDDGKSVVANPFTRAQYMLVCNTCNSFIRP